MHGIETFIIRVIDYTGSRESSATERGSSEESSSEGSGSDSEGSGSESKGSGETGASSEEDERAKELSNKAEKENEAATSSPQRRPPPVDDSQQDQQMRQGSAVTSQRTPQLKYKSASLPDGGSPTPSTAASSALPPPTDAGLNLYPSPLPNRRKSAPPVTPPGNSPSIGRKRLIYTQRPLSKDLPMTATLYKQASLVFSQGHS